jgi:hypothetical protein
VDIPLGDKVHPWGPISPIGANLTPGAYHVVKNWPQAPGKKFQRNAFSRKHKFIQKKTFFNIISW